MTTTTERLDQISAALDAGNIEDAKRLVGELRDYWLGIGKPETAVPDRLKMRIADSDAPFAPGDWVSRSGEERPMFGIVQDIFVGYDNDWLINLAVYDATGKRVGRVSEACGGPRGFEPALEAKAFTKISRPKFPLHDSEWSNKYASYVDKLGVKAPERAPGQIA